MTIQRELGPGPIQTAQTGQPDVDRELDKFARAIDARSDLSGARLIGGIKAVLGTPLRVEHGLGRKPRTWWVCAPNVASFISERGRDDKILWLDASATVTFDLVVV